MTGRDERFPPYWDRSVVVLDRPSADPAFPFVLWCGECHRIVNGYAARDEADQAKTTHEVHGGHHAR